MIMRQITTKASNVVENQGVLENIIIEGNPHEAD